MHFSSVLGNLKSSKNTRLIVKMKKQFVTRESLIGATVDKYPFLAELMLGYGLHCVGCSVSPVETIEDGVMSHGASEEEVDLLVAALNDAIELHGGDKTPVIEISDAAVKEIKKMAKAQKKEDASLRVRAQANGCCSITYSMGFAKEANEEDKKVLIKEINVVYSQKDENKLSGTIINFSKEKGFVLMNPKKKECKCN